MDGIRQTVRLKPKGEEQRARCEARIVTFVTLSRDLNHGCLPIQKRHLRVRE